MKDGLNQLKSRFKLELGWIGYQPIKGQFKVASQLKTDIKMPMQNLTPDYLP